MGTRRFTLVELMIVVAIVAVLAAVAVPLMNRFQNDAKAAEGELVTEGVYRAAKSYVEENGLDNAAYGNCPIIGGGSPAPNNTLRTMDTTACGWPPIAFAPDGAVRGSYRWNATPTWIFGAGLLDVDGDNDWRTDIDVGERQAGGFALAAAFLAGGDSVDVKPGLAVYCKRGTGTYVYIASRDCW